MLNPDYAWPRRTSVPYERKLDEMLKHLEHLEEQEDKNELFRQVGRAIVTLSNIENLMAMAFISVTQGMTAAEAGEFFYGQQTFEQKFKLVGYAIQQNDWGDEFAAWEVLSKRLQEQKLVRNLVAHQGMHFKQSGSSGKRKVILTAPWFKKKGRGKELELLDVKTAADKLESIHAEMWEFIKGLTPQTD